MGTTNFDLAIAVDRALTVLNHRLLTIVALVMTFGLFCLAMWLATWIQFAVATTFGALIFLPVLMNDKRPREVPSADETAS
jgi:branched-subunit amino acid transport protein